MISVNPINLLLLEALKKERQRSLACRSFTKAECLAKVIQSVIAFPLPIQTVQDCKELANVGPTYLSVLEKMLIEIAPQRHLKPPSKEVIQAYKRRRFEAGLKIITPMHSPIVEPSPTPADPSPVPADPSPADPSHNPSPNPPTLSPHTAEPSPTDPFPTPVDPPSSLSPRTEKVARAPKRRKKEKLTSLYYENPEVVMLIDSREVKNNDQICKIESLLKDENIQVEVKALAAGDICWICRFDETCVNTDTRERRIRKRDFMLPWLIERKQISDLYSSVMDGRYKSQKMRLTRFASSDPSQFVCNSEQNDERRQNDDLDEPSQKARQSILDGCRSIEPLCVMLVEAESSDLSRALFSSQAEMLKPAASRLVNMKVVRSAQIHTQVREQIRIMHSANLTHTASLLMRFHQNMVQKVKESVPGFMVDKKKRLSFPSWSQAFRPGSDETVASLMERQLRVIPKVTPRISSLLVEGLSCPFNLIEWLRCPPDRWSGGLIVGEAVRKNLLILNYG